MTTGSCKTGQEFDFFLNSCCQKYLTCWAIMFSSTLFCCSRLYSTRVRRNGSM